MYKSLFITRFLYFKLAIWINLIYEFKVWAGQREGMMNFLDIIRTHHQLSTLFLSSLWRPQNCSSSLIQGYVIPLIFNLSFSIWSQFLPIIDFDSVLKNLRRLINISSGLFDYLSIVPLLTWRPFNFRSNIVIRN